MINDKIVLITGATDGIGKQTAFDLARKGAKVIVHGRNNQKAEQIASIVSRETGNDHIWGFGADLSTLHQVRDLAEKIGNRFDKIDVMINNAGVFMNEKEQSKDGFELTFAVNHLAHFVLTGLLLELIKKSDYARIINVASMAHASRLDFDNLQGEKHFDGYDAYTRSKLCNILFTNKLARLLRDTHITANSLHPGVIRTKLLHAGWGGGGSDLANGSKTSVFLADSPDIAGLSGQYFANSRAVSASAVSYDISVQDRLWNLSEELSNFNYSSNTFRI